MPFKGFYVRNLRRFVGEDKRGEDFSFEQLSEDIFNTTQQRISPGELQELEEGRGEHLPIRYLDILANYANESGFENFEFWREPWKREKLRIPGDGDPKSWKYDSKGKLVNRVETE